MSQCTTANNSVGFSHCLVPASLCWRPTAHTLQMVVVASPLALTFMLSTLEDIDLTDAASRVLWQSRQCHVSRLAIGDWFVIRPRFASTPSCLLYISNVFYR